MKDNTRTSAILPGTGSRIPFLADFGLNQPLIKEKAFLFRKTLSKCHWQPILYLFFPRSSCCHHLQ